MAWPCREALWGSRLETAREATADVAKAISRFEPVTMLVRPDLTASVSLHCGPGIAVLPMPQDDSWTRDTGPAFVVDGGGRLAGVDWRFNGWGELYEDHSQDAQMAQRILDHLGLQRYRAPMVAEGGAIHVDGEGTCLVCETSILDPRRNPGLGRAEAETILQTHVGVESVIWLPYGLEDDETRGHVDNVACFARPGTVLALSSDDAADANHEGLSANLELLRAVTDARGRRLEVVPILQPKARKRDDGRRLTLSYINFYIANGGIVMPGFADAADKAAYRAIGQAFPDREITQLEVTDLIHGGGGIHCITQQQPAPQGESAA
jgi:agmatine deiminase